MVDLLKPLKQQAAWIAAALLLLLGLLLPVSAQAHVHGHHEVQEAHARVHSRDASTAKTFSDRAGAPELLSPAAPAQEIGNHCSNVCCSSGASCCVSSCLMPLSAGLGARDYRAVFPPRILGGRDGTEPARLTEPPIGF
jgi:hypothetical protein